MSSPSGRSSIFPDRSRTFLAALLGGAFGGLFGVGVGSAFPGGMEALALSLGLMVLGLTLGSGFGAFLIRRKFSCFGISGAAAAIVLLLAEPLKLNLSPWGVIALLWLVPAVMQAWVAGAT